MISEFEPGGALYQVIPEVDRTRDPPETFLLGLGLWDRANVKHTKEEKDRTKGQVVRIDRENRVLARSPELSNIVYQLQPTSEGRIFVGCRNGDLMYLNPDLSIRRKINFQSKGLYFWTYNGCDLVATMREGAVVFFSLFSGRWEDSDYAHVVQVVDPSIRMWPVLHDSSLCFHTGHDRYLAGSYRGHLVVIEDRKVVKVLDRVGEKRSATWTLDLVNNRDFLGEWSSARYLVGTARGEIWSFDRELEDRVLVFQNESAITATAPLNNMQIAIGDLKGDLHVWSLDGTIFHYPNPKQEQTHSNTIWWIAPEYSGHFPEDLGPKGRLQPDTRPGGILRVAYSNGQLRTFRAT